MISRTLSNALTDEHKNDIGADNSDQHFGVDMLVLLNIERTNHAICAMMFKNICCC